MATANPTVKKSKGVLTAASSSIVNKGINPKELDWFNF